MSNQFDSTNAPTTEPVEIIAGNFVQWLRQDLSNDYPTASYTLKYELRSEGTPARKITLTAADDGNGDYLISIPSATSLQYTVANYFWQAYITRNSDSERIKVDSGQISIKADFSTNSSNPASYARQMLGHIETALLNRASNQQLDTLAYNLDVDHSVTRDPSKLLEWREYWQRELVKEIREERSRKGLSHSGIIRAQF